MKNESMRHKWKKTQCKNDKERNWLSGVKCINHISVVSEDKIPMLLFFITQVVAAFYVDFQGHAMQQHHQIIFLIVYICVKNIKYSKMYFIYTFELKRLFFFFFFFVLIHEICCINVKYWDCMKVKGVVDFWKVFKKKCKNLHVREKSEKNPMNEIEMELGMGMHWHVKLFRKWFCTTESVLSNILQWTSQGTTQHKNINPISLSYKDHRKLSFIGPKLST